MTYMGVLYWLLPMLTGKKLWRPQLAVAQAYTWLIGMFMFGFTMGRAGLEGAIRRTDTGAAGAYVPESAELWMNLTAVAGVILLISSILLFAVILGTIFLSREDADVEAPIHNPGTR